MEGCVRVAFPPGLRVGPVTRLNLPHSPLSSIRQGNVASKINTFCELLCVSFNIQT